ncbi:MAG: protoporphyrinogen oxidase, partial [Bacteroidetes bacterium]|nr:protoporphyrinogen oxidase [Bacteroidota bacterium]
MPVNRVAVIGAGITGLTTAAILKRKGQPFDLFDRRGEPGGVIKTEQNGPWRYEYGPNTLLLKDADVKKFIESLGLKNQLKEANPEAAKRFVVKNGVLEPLPISVGGFLKTPLFSTAAKLRILKEPFVGTLQKEVTVAEFFEKRFGKEILDYAVNPFIAGIHAGRPESLSLQHAFPNIHQLEQEFGSVLYGAVRSTLGGGKKKEKKINRKLISFSEGLQQLPRAIVSELGDTYLNHEVKRINDENGTFTLETHMGSFGPYSNVVCTLPLHKWN